MIDGRSGGVVAATPVHDAVAITRRGIGPDDASSLPWNYPEKCWDNSIDKSRIDRAFIYRFGGPPSRVHYTGNGGCAEIDRWLRLMTSEERMLRVNLNAAMNLPHARRWRSSWSSLCLPLSLSLYPVVLRNLSERSVRKQRSQSALNFVSNFNPAVYSAQR